LKYNFPYPEFISPLMKLWLQQYKSEGMGEITKIGLFDWSFMPNKHNPEKPRRRPNLRSWEILIDSSFQRNIYFLEVNTDTLHVFEAAGFALMGNKYAFEYKLEKDLFIKNEKSLLRMIS
jgi:hypothetical protein